MKKIALFMVMLCLITLPVSALEIQAPTVPASGREWMPRSTDSIGEGLFELLDKGISYLTPALRKASNVGAKILCIVLLTSIVQNISNFQKSVCELVGCILISSILIGQTDSMIMQGMDTIQQISDYGKLLLPVMTGALAAQGGITASVMLYTGTATFLAVLTNVISFALVPGIELYLSVSMVACATGEEMLKRIADIIKNSSTWILKTLILVFTSFLGITGVISGTTDIATLKAAKVTISSVIPVVGGILSDASEAVLVSTGILKNAAGVYGIFAVLAILFEPFLRIMAQYLVLKMTGIICSAFESKKCLALIDSFATAMGLLLAITGGCCIMVMISTVCFMRSIQ